MDKIKEIDEHLDRLENRLKANFLEIEKRFAEIYEASKIPEDINERFNELEDLLLLLQVESTKLKEKFTGGLGFGAEVDTTSINERIDKLEERMSELSSANMPADLIEKINKIDKYNTIINEIRGRLERLELRGLEKQAVPKIIERKIGKEPIILPSKGLFEEVNKILKGG